MKTKKRQKICYNCNAQVDLEVIVCPYCGTDLLEEFDQDLASDEELDSRALYPQQTIASLYPPPYQTHDENYDDEESLETNYDSEEEESDEQKQAANPVAAIILTLSLSMLGLVLVLFFFSVDGDINLHINNKYLVLLLAASLPGIFWSWSDMKD